jgi:hypothetical protein
LKEIRNISLLFQQAGLLDELPPEGSRRLFELWIQIPGRRVGQAGASTPLERLRKLLIRLSEHWNRYRVIGWHKDVPNSPTLDVTSTHNLFLLQK